jgi:hypothetical protein
MLGRTVSFSLPTEDGELVRVPSATARATVLEFFAPTCVPCRERVPALAAKQDELSDRGASLVLVAVLADNESTEQARSALDQWGVGSLSFLVDRSGTSQREAGIRDLPETLVLNRAGRVTWVAPRTATAEDVVAAIR